MIQKLAFDPRCKTRVHELLVEKLPGLLIQRGNHLDPVSVVRLTHCDAALPRHIKEAAADYIAEFPFYAFAQDMLHHLLAGQLNYAYDAADCSLSALMDSRKIEELAASLSREFQSLPWDFMLTVRAGHAITDTLRDEPESTVCEDIRFIFPDDSYHLLMPRSTGSVFDDDKILGGPYLMMGELVRREPKWDSKECYIQLRIAGYAMRAQISQPVEAAFSVLRSLFGLSIAMGFFDIKRSTRYGLAELFGNEVLVHRLREGGASELWGNYDLPDDLAAANGELAWAGKARGSDWIKCIRIPFSQRGKYRQVLLAGEWFYYSVMSRGHATSFLQAVIAVEILAGSRPQEAPLTQLISDRCAYLIGQSRTEINKIVSTFKEIYGVRSAIVHGGKTRFGLREMVLLDNLQNICKRVLVKEIELITRDEDTEGATAGTGTR